MFSVEDISPFSFYEFVIIEAKLTLLRKQKHMKKKARQCRVDMFPPSTEKYD